MHEQDIRVTAPADVERLARSNGDDARLDAGIFFERGQQVREQSRLLGRRRRRDDDEPFL